MNRQEFEEFIKFVENHNLRDYNLSEALFFFLDAKIKKDINDEYNNTNEKKD